MLFFHSLSIKPRFPLSSACRKIRPNFFGRIVLLYKSNYLDSLIAACGAIHRAIRTNFRTVLKSTTLMGGVLFGALEGTSSFFERTYCLATAPHCSRYPPAHRPTKKQSTGLFFLTLCALSGFESPRTQNK